MCVTANGFILKQDIWFLRIHAKHQPRKLHVWLQLAIHTFYRSYPVKGVCVPVCVELCVSACAVQPQPCAVLCFSSFSCSLWHVDIPASCRSWSEAKNVPILARLSGLVDCNRRLVDRLGVVEYCIDGQYFSTFCCSNSHARRWSRARRHYSSVGLKSWSSRPLCICEIYSSGTKFLDTLYWYSVPIIVIRCPTIIFVFGCIKRIQEKSNYFVVYHKLAKIEKTYAPSSCRMSFCRKNWAVLNLVG